MNDTKNFPASFSQLGKPMGAPVRYVYLDEAGIQKSDLITVVAGIVVHADTQYRPVENAIRELNETVPERYREGFISHAMDVWNHPKYRDGWAIEERKEYLLSLAAIPIEFGLGIVFGVARHPVKATWTAGTTIEMTKLEAAFMTCICSAQEFMDLNCDESEIATVVHEDNNYKPQIQRIAKYLKTDGWSHPVTHLDNKTIGFPREIRKINYKLTRIRGTVHFEAGDESELLQLADVLAYGVRRFVENHIYEKGFDIGEELLWNIAGGDPKSVHTISQLRDKPNYAVSGVRLGPQPSVV
jgi:hypothetical protein